jgi:hypothetical protein
MDNTTTIDLAFIVSPSADYAISPFPKGPHGDSLTEKPLPASLSIFRGSRKPKPLAKQAICWLLKADQHLVFRLSVCQA